MVNPTFFSLTRVWRTYLTGFSEFSQTSCETLRQVYV